MISVDCFDNFETGRVLYFEKLSAFYRAILFSKYLDLDLKVGIVLVLNVINILLVRILYKSKLRIFSLITA